jgi:protein transport protein SEC24
MQASFSQSPTRNADPSYQRSTLNAIPTTNSLLQKSKIPLALILTPYRSLKPGDVGPSLKERSPNLGN